MDEKLKEPFAIVPRVRGTFHWCVHLKTGQNIYVFADECTIGQSGEVVFKKYEERTGENYPLFIVAGGHWTDVFAASCIDGTAVAVNYEIERDARDFNG